MREQLHSQPLGGSEAPLLLQQLEVLALENSQLRSSARQREHEVGKNGELGPLNP